MALLHVSGRYPDYCQRRAQTRRKIACHVRELEELGLEGEQTK